MLAIKLIVYPVGTVDGELASTNGDIGVVLEGYRSLHESLALTGLKWENKKVGGFCVWSV